MEQQYNQTFSTWNKLAELYQEKFMHLDIYNDSYDFFCNNINTANPSILDIGCGPGNIAKYILSKNSNCNLHGIDVAPNMITLARINNPTASFEVMDCRRIHQLTITFDGIICGFCLPYLSHEDSIFFFSNIKLLLNQNGILYLSFVDGDPSKSGLQHSSTGDQSYFYYYKLEEITQQLIKIGLEVIKIFHIDYTNNKNQQDTHTALIAKKLTP